MSAEKTDSIILSVAPYRETSCLLRLFTRSRGLMHGIAKGVRASGKSVPLDRGFLLESLVYYKPNRELHTIGSPYVINFFTEIRSDITKSAIRDIALELYLKTIVQSEPHLELFDLMVDFLYGMDISSGGENPFLALWRFIYKYCAFMGFGMDLRNCALGGIDAVVARYLDIDGGEIGSNPKHYSPNKNEVLRITEQLLQYCRRHFDICGQFNSFEFVKAL